MYRDLKIGPLHFPWASQETIPGGASGQEPACQCRRHIRDVGLIPGPGRSPGEGLDNHSSNLAWRIPRREEPAGL